MKHTLFLIILLRFTPLWANGPDQVISCHFHETSFAEFSNAIFLKSGVKIYYRENWVSQVKVNIDEDSITVLNAVELAIRNTDLQVSVWNNDLVLLPEERLVDTI